MKTKAKLILAMSVLTAGVVAAGATGTFAWFTTNRAAQLTYSTVTATKNAGNLDAYIAPENKSHTAWDDPVHAESKGGAKAAASAAAATKVSDISSRDGVSFCKPIWKTISGEGRPVSKHEKGERGIDYSTFYFKVTNMGNTPLQVYLNSETGIVASNAEDTEDKNAAKYTRIAINETKQEDATGKAVYALPTLTESSVTWLIENNVGTTTNYLPYVENVADDTLATSQALAKTGINHFTTGLAAVNTSSYTGLANQMIGKLDAANSDSPTAVKTRYYVVSVWLEGTKSDDSDFQNAADGSVNINIDLTAIQVAA